MGQSRIVRVGIDWFVLERFASGAVSLPFPRFFVGPAIASIAHPWRRTGAKDSEKVGMTGPRTRPDPPTHPARPQDQNHIRAGERLGTLSRLFHHVAASFQLAAPDKLKTCPHKVSATSVRACWRVRQCKDPFPGRAGADHGLRVFGLGAPSVGIRSFLSGESSGQPAARMPTA